MFHKPFIMNLLGYVLANILFHSVLSLRQCHAYITANRTVKQEWNSNACGHHVCQFLIVIVSHFSPFLTLSHNSVIPKWNLGHLLLGRLHQSSWVKAIKMDSPWFIQKMNLLKYHWATCKIIRKVAKLGFDNEKKNRFHRQTLAKVIT